MCDERQLRHLVPLLSTTSIYLDSLDDVRTANVGRKAGTNQYCIQESGVLPSTLSAVIQYCVASKMKIRIAL
jgi:hypothetical protein